MYSRFVPFLFILSPLAHSVTESNYECLWPRIDCKSISLAIGVVLTLVGSRHWQSSGHRYRMKGQCSCLKGRFLAISSTREMTYPHPPQPHYGRSSNQIDHCLQIVSNSWVPAWMRLQPTTILIFLTFEQLKRGVDWTRSNGIDLL
jgi:hypothetical protein